MMLRHCGKGDHITRLALAARSHTLCHSITEASSFQQLQVYVKHFHSPWQQSLLALCSSSCYPLSQAVVSHTYRKKNTIPRLAFLVQPKGIAVAAAPHPTHPLQDTGSHVASGSSPSLPVQLWMHHQAHRQTTAGAMLTTPAMNTGFG